MEWGLKENRVAVIALHKCGHPPVMIFKLLQNLKITKQFVYRTIERFSSTLSVDDRERSGRPRTVRTPAVIKAVKARIARNPIRKQKLMAIQMSVKRSSLKKIINEDLGLHAYRRHTGHLLNTRLKTLRLQRSRALLKRYAKNGHRKILFSDEKIFTVEENFNRQNDKVYAKNSQEANTVAPKVQRGHHPSSVMVWLGVCYEGFTKVHFCEKGVKTGAKVYQDTVLGPVVRALGHTLFKNQPWIFQQDSAPAHKAKSTQDWLRANKIDFIAHEDWPSSSPDLNPLDYALWQVIEEKACAKRHTNLESLKKAIIKTVADVDMNVVRAAIDAWPQRLKACVSAKGGHFE